MAAKKGKKLREPAIEEPNVRGIANEKQFGFKTVSVRKYLRLPTDSLGGPKFGSLEIGMDIEVSINSQLGTVEEATEYIDDFINKEFRKQEKEFTK